MNLSYEEAQDRYGAIRGAIWQQEPEWCVLADVPLEIKMINTATGKVAGYIYCNKDMAAPLVRAFHNVVERGLCDQLKTFDGCYNIRFIRGQTGTLSTHSYALAVDFNAATNMLGTNGDMSDELAECFTDEGFTWGKEFSRKDPMHFQFGVQW